MFFFSISSVSQKLLSQINYFEIGGATWALRYFLLWYKIEWLPRSQLFYSGIKTSTASALKINYQVPDHFAVSARAYKWHLQGNNTKIEIKYYICQRHSTREASLNTIIFVIYYFILHSTHKNVAKNLDLCDRYWQL